MNLLSWSQKVSTAIRFNHSQIKAIRTTLTTLTVELCLKCLQQKLLLYFWRLLPSAGDCYRTVKRLSLTLNSESLHFKKDKALIWSCIIAKYMKVQRSPTLAHKCMAKVNFFTAKLNFFMAKVNIFTATLNFFTAKVNFFTAKLDFYPTKVYFFTEKINFFSQNLIPSRHALRACARSYSLSPGSKHGGDSNNGSRE